MTLGLNALMPVMAATARRAAVMYAAIGGLHWFGRTGLAIATLVVFNKGLSKNRRRLDEVTAAQNRRNAALRASVRAMNKEAEGLSDKELKKRIEALKKEQETLDDSVKAYDGYLPNIAYSEELQTAALAASKERQEGG